MSLIREFYFSAYCRTPLMVPPRILRFWAIKTFFFFFASAFFLFVLPDPPFASSFSLPLLIFWLCCDPPLLGLLPHFWRSWTRDEPPDAPYPRSNTFSVFDFRLQVPPPPSPSPELLFPPFRKFLLKIPSADSLRDYPTAVPRDLFVRGAFLRGWC